MNSEIGKYSSECSTQEMGELISIYIRYEKYLEDKLKLYGDNSLTMSELENRLEAEDKAIQPYYDLYESITQKYIGKFNNIGIFRKIISTALVNIYGLISIPLESSCYFLEEYNTSLSKKNSNKKKIELYSIRSEIWQKKAVLIDRKNQEISLKLNLQNIENNKQNQCPNSFQDIKLLVESLVEENKISEEIKELKLKQKSIVKTIS